MLFLRKGFRKINGFTQAIRPKLVTRNANAAYMRKTLLSACSWALGSSEGQAYAPDPYTAGKLEKALSGFYEKSSFLTVFATYNGYSLLKKAIDCNYVDEKERLQAAHTAKKYVNVAVLPVKDLLINLQSYELLCL